MRYRRKAEKTGFYSQQRAQRPGTHEISRKPWGQMAVGKGDKHDMTQWGRRTEWNENGWGFLESFNKD